MFREIEFDEGMIKSSEFGEYAGRPDTVGGWYGWDVGVSSVES